VFYIFYQLIRFFFHHHYNLFYFYVFVFIILFSSRCFSSLLLSSIIFIHLLLYRSPMVLMEHIIHFDWVIITSWFLNSTSFNLLSIHYALLGQRLAEKQFITYLLLVLAFLFIIFHSCGLFIYFVSFVFISLIRIIFFNSFLILTFFYWFSIFVVHFSFFSLFSILQLHILNLCSCLLGLLVSTLLMKSTKNYTFVLPNSTGNQWNCSKNISTSVIIIILAS